MMAEWFLALRRVLAAVGWLIAVGNVFSYCTRWEDAVREAAPVWSVFGLLLVLVALISSRNGR